MRDNFQKCIGKRIFTCKPLSRPNNFHLEIHTSTMHSPACIVVLIIVSVKITCTMVHVKCTYMYVPVGWQSNLKNFGIKSIWTNLPWPSIHASQPGVLSSILLYITDNALHLVPYLGNLLKNNKVDRSPACIVKSCTQLSWKDIHIHVKSEGNCSIDKWKTHILFIYFILFIYLFIFFGGGNLWMPADTHTVQKCTSAPNEYNCLETQYTDSMNS